MEEKAGLDTAEMHLMQDRDKLNRRQQELSTLLFKLFEDHAAGLISDANYISFTKRYQSEQAEIEGKFAVLETKLEQQVDYQVATDQLRQTISNYLNIETLTPLILNKLVEKIQVGQVEKVDGQAIQDVTIVWRFAGMV